MKERDETKRWGHDEEMERRGGNEMKRRGGADGDGGWRGRKERRGDEEMRR